LGIPIVWSPPKAARLIGIGSVLEQMPVGTKAFVLGSGFMYEKSRLNVPQSQVLAVRGRLSAARLGVDCDSVVLGDLGLLLEIGTVGRRKVAIGLIPHYVDKKDDRLDALQNRLGSDIILIDVEAPNVAETAETIASCGVIISSSLHGLVAAWALGIPCAWIELSDKVLGAGFKFRDFFSAFDIAAKAQRLTGHESLAQLRELCIHPPPLLKARKNGLWSALNQANSLLSVKEYRA
jgi:pyruvyltransferase